MDDQQIPEPPPEPTEGQPAEDAYVELQGEEWQDSSEPNTFPSGETLEADRRDATAAHEPDPVEPGSEDLDAPDRVDPSVAEAERASLERGANLEGEGEIVPSDDGTGS